MKLLKALVVMALLSTSLSAAHAQQPMLGDLLGGGAFPPPNTLPVQLLGLASPLLEIAGIGTDAPGALLPSTPLGDTLFSLNDSGAGALGVLAPLASGVLISGGVDGLLRLMGGLPALGDLPVADLLLGITAVPGFDVF